MILYIQKYQTNANCSAYCNPQESDIIVLGHGHCSEKTKQKQSLKVRVELHETRFGP